jgi:hypothetical protein
MRKFISILILALLLSGCSGNAAAADVPPVDLTGDTGSEADTGPDEAAETSGMMYSYSTTIETEKPELDETTRELIAAYRNNPTQENYDRLREQVGINYDAVLEKKKAKLEELRLTARDQSKIDEMEEIVQEMIQERENRIDQTMRRFTDPRLRPGSSDPVNGFVPVMGAGENIYISQTPITNSQYAVFVRETGHLSPSTWNGGVFPDGQDDYPVTGITFADAEAYCAWVSASDSDAIYRLPTETEWEYAAGHMPKDAPMNSGGARQGITSVYEFSDTSAASGAIDMWGNVWEWTATGRNADGEGVQMAIKGGAWDSPKTSCRTENRTESRAAAESYENVGFRIIRELP